MISNKELDFWIKNGLNVLFIGEYGIGKTSTVLDAFKRNKLRFKYLSGSTLDPWVDLIGVPKEVVDENNTRVLDLIKPKEWAYDEVDAIFIDEFNRAHKKVTNAVMELIQFKSINGKKYSNLKIIWAAVNPDESKFQENTYNVEQFDAAVKDRFHIHVDLPYKPSIDYLKNKFTQQVAESAINWWNALPDKVKGQVSPRRLDYALDIHFKGGNLKYVLPQESNIKKLVKDLASISIKQQLMSLVTSGDVDAAREWLANDNNYFSAVDEIFANDRFVNFFVPVFPKEKISNILSGSDAKSKVIYDMGKSNTQIKGIIDNIVKSGQNKAVANNLSMLNSLVSTIWDINPSASSNYNFDPKVSATRFEESVKLAVKRLGAGQDTHARRSAVEEVMSNTGPYDTLNVSDVLDVLNICNIFYKHSYSSTIKKMGNDLTKYINYLMVYLINNKIPIDEVYKKNNHVFDHLSCDSNFIFKRKSWNQI
jgi:MoxR-like ATPase